MKAHPAADLFPMMPDEELAALVEDIRSNGLIESVWVYRDGDVDVLLDGRNRVEACNRLGIEFTSKRYTGDDPVGFVVSQNIRRRHLSTGQRAMLALEVEKHYAIQNEKRKAHGMTAPGKPMKTLVADLRQATARDRKASEQAARKMGTSGRAVQQAKRVAEADPELAASVRAGDVAIDRAERILRDREAEARRIDKADAERQSVEIGVRVDVRHGDFREVLSDLSDVDAIITDPPYPKEYLALLADLAQWADKVLKPDGILAVLFGQTYLPDVYRLLSNGRPYRWTMAYMTPGAGYASHVARVQSNWKPVLIYGGGPRFGDVLRSEGTDANAKALHQWGQDYSAFHVLVDRLTMPGQLVVDPFSGSGTTLLAAQALGRHAIGCDTDAEHTATARRRLGLRE